MAVFKEQRYDKCKQFTTTIGKSFADWQLFSKSKDTINLLYLSFLSIFETGELKEEATISKMETVQQKGNREVKLMVVMYKLDAMISVGYRVNILRATQFKRKQLP